MDKNRGRPSVEIPKNQPKDQNTDFLQVDGGAGRGVPIEKNWWEFRFRSKQPERRAYHSTFEHDSK